MKTLHKTLLVLILLILIGLVGLIGMQNWWIAPKLTGNITTKTFTPHQLSELSIGGLFTVNFTQSDTNEIKITTDEALLKCITAKENAGKFSLSHKGNCFWFGRGIPKITVDVSFQQLKRLDLGGASSAYTLTSVLLNEHLLLKVSGASEAELDITAPKIQADISWAGVLKLIGQTPLLAMRVSGASKLYLTTQSTDLQLKVSGASKVTASGSSESLSVDASGASEVNASKVLVDKAALEASGASNIKVHAKELISSKSTGASDIENLE